MEYGSISSICRDDTGENGHYITYVQNDTSAIDVVISLKFITEKAFHKNAKTCRAGFHKKPTKQDGTHMTIRSQITIPTGHMRQPFFSSAIPTYRVLPYSMISQPFSLENFITTLGNVSPVKHFGAKIVSILMLLCSLFFKVFFL